MSMPEPLLPSPTTVPAPYDGERLLDAVADETSEGVDESEQWLALPSSEDLGSVDDSKIRRCVTALLDDRARQGGRLSPDDVDRVTSRRGLSPEETLEVWRSLDAAGITLGDATIVSGYGGRPGSTGEDAEASLTDSVRAYMDRIGQIRLLTAAEEVTLARRIRAGEIASDALAAGRVPSPQLQQQIEMGRAARSQMITANLRLVVSVARRYTGRVKLDLLDLVQEGTLGLIRAVERFDHERGFKFSTYATWWIRQAITRAIADKGRTIRLPVHVHERLNRILAKRRRLSTELGHEPTIRQLADDLDEAPETVAFLLDISREVLSLDQPIGDDEDTTLGSLVATVDHAGSDPLDAAEYILLQEAIDALLLDELTEREQRVITLRFGLDGRTPETLEQVGQRFHLTRERIRQIQEKALEKLRGAKSLRRLEDYA
jgi:RNA polymerase primary sigma factor